MESLFPVLDPILVLALLATTLAYLAGFLGGRTGQRRSAGILLGATLVMMVARFGLFVVSHGRPPLAAPAEAFTTIALSVTVVTVLLEVLSRDRSTAFLLLAAATLFQGASLLGDPVGAEVSEVLRQRWFGAHAVTAILGYTAFAISAVYAVLFLLLYGDLKRRRFGVVYDQVPSLEELSRTSIRSATLGFAFLTAAIIVGAVGWSRVIEMPAHRDPKVLSTAAVWIVYGSGLSLYHFAGWRGIRCIGITLVAFLLMILSSWLLPFLLSSSHSVRGLA